MIDGALIDNLAVPSPEAIQAKIDASVAPLQAQVDAVLAAQAQIQIKLGIITITDPPAGVQP